MNNHEFEDYYYSLGHQLIAGVDEVGRGPLAGPLVVTALILKRGFFHPSINDSKKLNKKTREKLVPIIEENALAISTIIISPEEIDRLNIYQATKMAMIKAVETLEITPDIVLVDAMKLGKENCIPIIKGDQKSFTIAASSIIAKVIRDKIMADYDVLFPQYDFKNNNGYGTKKHLEAINQFGITSIHRKTYAPVKEKLLV